MAEVPGIYFKITINGKDATRDLTPFIMSLTYTDNLNGIADELQFELDNTDFRFLNDWYITTGMIVKLWIGEMNCGQFTVDNPVQSGPPHVSNIRAQSAGFKSPFRTKRSFAHYKKGLDDIVGKYATDYNLRVVGNIPKLTLTTTIQSRETDIHFLHRLARTYGCICAVKGDTLVFDALENVWKRNAAKTLRFSDIKNYHFETTMPETADAGLAIYSDPATEEVNGSVVSSSETINGKLPDYIQQYNNIPLKSYGNAIPPGTKYTTYDSDYDTPSQITKVNYKKAESNAEAQRIAMGDMLSGQMKKHTCVIAVPGNELLVAGNAVDILEFGKRSGYWLIEKSIHKIVPGSKGGYDTTIYSIHGAASATGPFVPPVQTVDSGLNSGAPQTSPGSIQRGLGGGQNEQP